MTLTEFLLARIAEDEAQGRAALVERRRVRYVEGHPANDPDFEDHELVAYGDVGVPAVLVGCERVLAECEAKRRIVQACDYDGMTADYVLATLAEVYAGHPDYDEGWRP